MKTNKVINSKININHTILLSLLLFFWVLNSCSNNTNQKQIENKSQYYKLTGFAQGTTYSIVYESDSLTITKSKIDSILNKFDLSLSTYKENSIISKINQNISTKTDRYFNEVYYKAKELFEVSEGKFDITIGPIVNAYGFGPGKKDSINQKLLDSLLHFVGMNKIRLENNRLIKSNPNIKLDCNAIAQGYSVDIIAEMMNQLKIENYLIEIGGELRCKGVNHKDSIWRVGIDKPVENSNESNRELQAIIHLKNKSLATSGNYRKFYIENGIKYSHSIDPKTGLPKQDSILSATIVANDCITADAYATTCMVSGLEKALGLIQSNPELEAYFIYADKNGNYQIIYTKGIEKILKKID